MFGKAMFPDTVAVFNVLYWCPLVTEKGLFVINGRQRAFVP